MMKFLESIINMKLNGIQGHELKQIAKQYGVFLSSEEAEAIAFKLRGKNYNIFNPTQRKEVVNQISAIVGTNKAKQIENVFLSMTGR
ncbi:MAG: DUF2624 family protein [Bacillus sp. (in: firmicutes)]